MGFPGDIVWLHSHNFISFVLVLTCLFFPLVHLEQGATTSETLVGGGARGSLVMGLTGRAAWMLLVQWGRLAAEGVCARSCHRGRPRAFNQECGNDNVVFFPYIDWSDEFYQLSSITLSPAGLLCAAGSSHLTADVVTARCVPCLSSLCRVSKRIHFPFFFPRPGKLGRPSSHVLHKLVCGFCSLKGCFFSSFSAFSISSVGLSWCAFGGQCSPRKSIISIKFQICLQTAVQSSYLQLCNCYCWGYFLNHFLFCGLGFPFFHD